MNSNYETILRLLSDFDAFVNNRSISTLSWSKEFIPKILEWHFEMWNLSRRGDSTTEDYSDTRFQYRHLYSSFSSILVKVEERTLKEGTVYNFFYYFKRHVEKHHKRLAASNDDKEYSYMEGLFSMFYRPLFESTDTSPDRNNIWEHFFPDEWKIRKSHIQNEKNIVVNFTLNFFMSWARDRILDAKEDYDRKLDDAMRNLFPELDPILWAQILIFIFSPYAPDNRIKSVIERPWNFGRFGRSITFTGTMDKEIIIRSREKQFEGSTFEMAYLLLPNQFSKDNLSKYIATLKELKYEEHSRENTKQTQLLYLFEEMLKYEIQT